MPVDRYQGALRALAVGSGIWLALLLSSGIAAAARTSVAREGPGSLASHDVRACRLETGRGLVTPGREALAPRTAARAAPRRPGTAPDTSLAFTSSSHARACGALARRGTHGRRRTGRRAAPGRRPRGRRRARPGRAARLAPRSSSSIATFVPHRHDSRHHAGGLRRARRRGAALGARCLQRLLRHRARQSREISSGPCRPRAARHGRRRRSAGRSRARGRRGRRRRRARRRSRSRPHADVGGVRAPPLSRCSASTTRAPSRSRVRRSARSARIPATTDPRAVQGAAPRPGLEPARTGGVPA